MPAGLINPKETEAAVRTFRANLPGGSRPVRERCEIECPLGFVIEFAVPVSPRSVEGLWRRVGPRLIVAKTGKMTGQSLRQPFTRSLCFNDLRQHENMVRVGNAFIA